MTTERPTPPPKPKRIHTAFRISETGAQWLDQIAAQHGVARADVLRASLAVARRFETHVIKIIEDQK